MLALLRFCAALRFGAVLLALYFSSVAGSYALGMSVFSLTSLAQLAADVPTGYLADRLGRKPVLALGAIVSLAFTVGYAVGLSYWWLAAGAALEGLARALVSGTDTALLYEMLAEAELADRYPLYLGRVAAGESVAFALAAFAGGAIAAFWSFHAAFWLTLAPQCAALVCALLLREPAHRLDRRRVSWRRALTPFLRNPRLRLVVGAAAWREAWSESAFQLRIVFFQQLWPLWALGLAQTLTNAVSALSFYLAGRTIARLGALRVLLLDVIIGRALALPALLAPTVASPVALSLMSATYGMSEVAFGALQQQEFSDEERATMGSIASQAVGLAFAAGAVAVGALADSAGVVAALLITQALLLGSIVLYRGLAAG
ncbi:MAG TPA: MFS transporter [Dehalococcoidia bacterium]|nr:MFS transporter [Dehalococcoidia bacterium]